MPEYLAPGVYVEEIQTGNKPIEGVSTSTTGLVGVTERGPVDVEGEVGAAPCGKLHRPRGETLPVDPALGGRARSRRAPGEDEREHQGRSARPRRGRAATAP